MALDLSDTLVVGISSTALFDMEESDRLFRDTHKSDPDTAIEIYRTFMMEREEVPLGSGTGHPLVRALLNLNQYQKLDDPLLVEVVVMSRNSTETGLRILNTIRHENLAITRFAFTSGESVVDYIPAFDVDLFLTTNKDDAQKVVDSGVCAAALLFAPPEGINQLPDDQVRIAFDGDAVLFSEESELVYKTEGLKAFQDAEDAKQDIPLGEGPYATLLKKIGRLRERLSGRIEYSPIRIALVTARNRPAEIRVVKTLRAWGVYVDECFFLGGVGKDKIVAAFRAHIFFDDQELQLEKAARLVPAGRVPYQSTSQLVAFSNDSVNNEVK